MCRVVLLNDSVSFIIAENLLQILEKDTSLEQCFLIYDFLNKACVEFEILLEEDKIINTSDFDELTSLRDIVLISIYNKNRIFVKYFLHEMYQRDDLTGLIRILSDTLMLVNLVDPIIGQRVWNEAFDLSVFNYFFYLVMIFEKSYEDKDKPDGSNERFDIFKRETDRLKQFFGTFVKGKKFEEVSNKIEIMKMYLSAHIELVLKQKLNELIESRVVRTKHFLVDLIDDNRRK